MLLLILKKAVNNLFNKKLTNNVTDWSVENRLNFDITKEYFDKSLIVIIIN
jgi:hypothetical protein